MKEIESTELNKMELESKDLVAERIDEMRELFPEVFSEGGIDFEKLRLVLGDEVDDGDERYAFTWPGKRDAIRQSQTPSAATLRPCPEESVNWDTTQNLYIEGDNLEVLKLLQRAYSGSVKMIYIDPPYNTGNDFVYKDSFEDSIANYQNQTGQSLQSNPETAGRYHANWCSMIYPRLRLARELLSDDGAILVSIDDNEQATLKKILDEIFGESNFLATLIWEKTRKNDARYFSNGHEYILVYGKSVAALTAANTYWREDKPGGEEIAEEYQYLLKKYGSDYPAMEKELRKYFRDLPKDHPAKKYARYSHIDETGIWRDDNMSWPGGGGPTFNVFHPVTGKPCKVPPGGWRYSSPERMQEAIDAGKVVFREDETEPPIRKTFLIRKSGRFSDDEEDEGIGRQVMGTYFYRSSLQASNVINDLFGARVFDYPKDHEILKRLIKYITDKDSIVLDFFSGSASTAHAVEELNNEDGGNRRFIMVQLPEPTAENTVAYKNGYRSICEIGEERLRRVGRQIETAVEEDNKQLQIGGEPKKAPDIGFRVLKLDDSGIATAKPGELLLDRIKPDRSDEDIIFEMMLKWGLELTYPIEQIEVCGYTCYSVAGDALICCMKPGLTVDVIEAIAAREPDRVFMLDSVLDDSLKLNALQIFKRVEERTQRKIDLRTV